LSNAISIESQQFPAEVRMLPLPNLPRIVGRQNNRNNVPARTPEEYCRRAVFLQDFAFKFSKIFRKLPFL
jgi:hypothetical protein